MRHTVAFLALLIACGVKGESISAPTSFATRTDSVAIARLLAEELRVRPGGRLHVTAAPACPFTHPPCRRIGDWGSPDAATPFLAPIRTALGDTATEITKSGAVCRFTWSTPPDSVRATALHDYRVLVSPPVFGGDTATLYLGLRCANYVRGGRRSGFASDEMLTFRKFPGGWSLVSRMLNRIT